MGAGVRRRDCAPVAAQMVVLSVLVGAFLIGIWRLVIDGIHKSTWNYRRARAGEGGGEVSWAPRRASPTACQRAAAASSHCFGPRAARKRTGGLPGHLWYSALRPVAWSAWSMRRYCGGQSVASRTLQLREGAGW